MLVDGMIMSVEYDQRQAVAVDAIERLFRAEAPKVWRSVLASSGGRREIADEAVAEAFARAIAYEGRIRRPLAWLYQVSFRLAAAEMRRQRQEDAETVEVAVELPEVVGVFEALRQLTPIQRAAVVMFHEVDLPVSEGV